MDELTGRCRAHFWGGTTRCDRGSGHEGNHLSNGFAEWDDQLAHWPPVKEELF